MKLNRKKLVVGILKVSILFLFIFLIVNFVGANDLISVLVSVSLSLFLLSLVFEPFVILLTGLSYKVLLMPLNHKIKTLYATRVAGVGYALGFITPARAAELAITLPLQKKGVSIGEGLAMLATDKILSTIILVSAGVLGIIFFGGAIESLLIALGLIILFGIVFAIVISKKSKKFIVKYALKGNEDHLNDFLIGIKTIFSSKKHILIVLFFKFLKWMFSFFSVTVIFYSLGYPISVHIVGMIFSLVVIFSTIPITISGLGLKEGSGALLYNALAGVPPAIATNAMILSTANIFIVSVIYYAWGYNLVLDEKNLRILKFRRKKDKISKNQFQ